jgi:hypothetical protein
VEEEQQLYESLLDKHIERKVNASLRRTLQQESRRGDAPSPSPPTGSSYGPHAGGEAHQPKVTGEIIPWFDPENQSCLVTSWVCYMQLRLKGAARDLFNRLTDYDKTWEEWKALLQHAFPRCVDYATPLEELVARKKLPNESMTTYYHAKLSLIRQCRLDNEATLSCLIKGLPLDLQSNARAFQCHTPDELYAGFLAPLDNYEVPNPTKRMWNEEDYMSGTGGRVVRNKAVRCHRCGRSGHKPKQTVLRGFGGARIECSTECEFVLKIDGLALDTSAVLTTADMGDVDLIVGQPVINREGLLFLVSEGKQR